MSNGKKSSTTSESKSEPTAREQSSTGSNVADKVIDQESAQGFRGVEVDPTPNENYTVAGVTSGAPTPETDVASAQEARATTGLGLTALEAQQREREANEAAKANRSKK
jgi:hypothetical protein